MVSRINTGGSCVVRRKLASDNFFLSNQGRISLGAKTATAVMIFIDVLKIVIVFQKKRSSQFVKQLTFASKVKSSLTKMCPESTVVYVTLHC